MVGVILLNSVSQSAGKLSLLADLIALVFLFVVVRFLAVGEQEFVLITFSLRCLSRVRVTISVCAWVGFEVKLYTRPQPLPVV